MFNTLELLPPDPVLGIPVLFQQDLHPKKVNLSVGAYQDGEGRSYVLEAVRDAESRIAASKPLKNYLPIEGDPEYIALTAKLIFGDFEPERFFGAQCVGGTSALRLGADFLVRNKVKVIAVSNPSWPNHAPIFKQAGLEVVEYPYYNPQIHQIEFSRLIDSLKKLPKESAVLLQGCCHNPTGMDLEFPQWQELFKTMQNLNLLPFFDFAYQGFGEGLDADAKAIRFFASQGIEMVIAYSFSKNMGLYGERAGFFGVLMDRSSKGQVASQVKQLIRSNYSNPPIHPARIVTTILKDAELKKEWERELNTMRERVQCMREALAFGLSAAGAQKDFSFLLRQKGVFSYSGLTFDEVQSLRNEWGIYLLDNGRMNVAGINAGNLDSITKAMTNVSNAS